MTRIQANLLLLLAALVWGATFSAQRIGMESLGPATYTAARFALGALVVAPFAWRELRGAGPGRIGARGMAAIAALGLALFGGAVLQQVGLVHTTATNASFLTGLYVPLVPLIGLAFGQRPHGSVWVAAAACVAGLYLLSVRDDLTFGPGDLWVLAGALFWAAHVLLVGALAQRLPVFAVATGQFLVCALASGLWAAAVEAPTLGALADGWLPVVWGGALSVGFAFTLQVVAQSRTGAAEAAVILSTETVFGALFGALLLGERLDARGAAGCALILAGMLACQLLPLWRRRPRPAAEPA